ncbi:MAG: hypothetical protein IPK16_12615 [Anaerolineales bacterium]|nr:hypothetical protein [Anaerolineales bacterium]
MNPEPSPLIAVLTMYLRGIGALAEGIGPLVAAAMTFVQNLRTHCPEAFDESGNLRPDWQSIVKAKFDATPVKAAAHKLHVELITRRISVHPN